MLNRRLALCAVVAVALYYLPFAYVRYGADLFSGLTAEAAGWGGIGVGAVAWLGAGFCCFAGLWFSLLLLLRKSVSAISIIGTLACAGVLLSMGRLFG